MKREEKEIVRKALKLSMQERAEIIARLLDSLEDEDADSAWTAELERRARELETGEVEGIPWEEVRKALLSRCNQAVVGEDVQGDLRGKD